MIMTFLHMKALICFFFFVFVPTSGNDLLSCETTSPDASGYSCIQNNKSSIQCATFALIHTNPYFSSLSNLTHYLGLNRFVIAKSNGFSPENTEILSNDQPLLIPIDCKCSKHGFFYAELTKTTIKGESFHGIAESLEGLTTCKAIKDRNPGVSPSNLDGEFKLLIPLRCACPVSSSQEQRALLSYPVSKGDTVSNLASKFNVTIESIISTNNLSSSEGFETQSLTPFTCLLIPLLNNNPVAKPSNNPVISPHKKTKMWRTELCIGLAGVALGLFIASLVGFFFIRLKNKKQSVKNNNKCKELDMELQHLNLSVRTTSDKKVSFEVPHEGKILEAATPRKMFLETYTREEIRNATEDFSSSNHIEGPVFHGRLNGKNIAIKRTTNDVVSKIEFGLFHHSVQRHPNILMLLGTTSLLEGPDSYLVFEYAKNGSLKDWLHGGLAIKNQFIASCYCFLTWRQRLRICLDIAGALQYMHHVMIPSYVHRNIKSRNIFLDEEFGAKLGNFGMAMCAENETEDPHFYSTNPASWSLGYLAPEFVHQGVVSPSIDVFAYGVVLLEVLSGQTPISRPNDKGEGSVWLTDKIRSILASEKNASELREWVDSALGENYSFDAAFELANIARACVEDEASLRPSANEIVDKISRLVEEFPDGEHHMLITESSSKPLVNAV
ncbi:hypothetical protein HN51_041495 [Arachis hypogaea]|uniref:Protein LYK2 n=1 Tax=Arachis hypogaea TaxID=3818 RepID=A0A444YST5_ARAHY|nr:protein LYK2 [Arachis ipaensis]XP_025658807.1 protein LYK2-like [Arachis hypogaea]QHN87255.1 hypothetical protein DS421_16g553480 [Arachis hypogaea]RYR04992.1 hypothetical protein Ahy_B06g084821 [Arachis hypogaea]